MTERPILFSAPMVRALLAGTKTQTRRPLKVQPPAGTFQVSTYHHPDPRPHFFAWQELPHETAMIADDWAYPCPYGAAGDRLWVREAFAGSIAYERHGYPLKEWGNKLWYIADGEPRSGQWTRPRPSIHMPRSLSRITLQVTAVRVERLQDISEADAVAEGIEPITDTGPGAGPNRFGVHAGTGWLNAPTAAGAYRMLWNLINGDGAWAANPWVWCVTFSRVEAA